MKIYVFPIISLLLSFAYYVPWIGIASRASLGPYIVAFLWFLGAWLIGLFYAYKAIENKKLNKVLSKQYLVGFVMFLISYLIVFIGIFNGYMVSV